MASLWLSLMPSSSVSIRCVILAASSRYLSCSSACFLSSNILPSLSHCQTAITAMLLPSLESGRILFVCTVVARRESVKRHLILRRRRAGGTWLQMLIFAAGGGRGRTLSPLVCVIDVFHVRVD